MFGALEIQLVTLFNQLAIHNWWFLSSARFFSVWAIFIIVGFFIASAFFDWQFIRVSGKLLFLEGVLAAVTAWIINQLISLIYFRPRPFVTHTHIEALIDKSGLSKSFPSDHTVLAMTLASVIFLWSPRIGSWFLVIALIIGFSRVVVGVHYPSDILAGIVIGGLIGILIHKIFV